MPLLEALKLFKLVSCAVDGHNEEREVGNHPAEAELVREERHLTCKQVYQNAQFQNVRNLHPFLGEISVEKQGPQIPQGKRRRIKIPVGMSPDYVPYAVKERNSQKVRPHKSVERCLL